MWTRRLDTSCTTFHTIQLSFFRCAQLPVDKIYNTLKVPHAGVRGKLQKKVGTGAHMKKLD